MKTIVFFLALGVSVVLCIVCIKAISDEFTRTMDVIDERNQNGKQH